MTPKLLAAKAFRDGGENVASELANEGLEKFVAPWSRNAMPCNAHNSPNPKPIVFMRRKSAAL